MPFIQTRQGAAAPAGSNTGRDSWRTSTLDSHTFPCTSLSSMYTDDSETLGGTSGKRHRRGLDQDVSPGTSLHPRNSRGSRSNRSSEYQSTHASSVSTSKSKTPAGGDSHAAGVYRDILHNIAADARGQPTQRPGPRYDFESTTSVPSADTTGPEAPAWSRTRHAPPVMKTDVSPGTGLFPRSSVDTYASTTVSDEEMDVGSSLDSSSMGCSDHEIPPLPVYRREIVNLDVRPATPREFAQLFPSLNRLSIRHDEFTPDGNMNLRVDTVAPGPRGSTVQLFHLRMHDLAKRDFSLRRYCRDSGREVCNAKRQYVELGSSDGRPTLQRSVTTALRTLSGAKPPFGRRGSGGSLFRRPSLSSSSGRDHDDQDDHFAGAFGHALDSAKHGPPAQKAAPKPRATNTIKLEFSNYARVDVSRRGSRRAKRYEFQWWGHRYSWKRVAEKHLGIVAFHLVRDGDSASPVAHIVPETRSPNQIWADEVAGGWIPPCHMYISDTGVIDAMTDVAE